MDWAAAERRRVPGTVEAALWDGLRRLIAARRATRATHAQGAGQPLWTGNDHVYGAAAELRRRAAAAARELQRRRAAGPRPRSSSEHGLALDASRPPRPTAARCAPTTGDLVLAPYQFLWIIG